MPAGGRMLHEGLHGFDVVLLGHQELLGKLGDLLVAVFTPAGVFQHQDHPPGVALDHHARDFGVGLTHQELSPGHPRAHAFGHRADLLDGDSLALGEELALGFQTPS